jgi:hypothetical protein
MPEEQPTRTPVETPMTTPDPERERRTDPERLCPAQKEEITRRIGPLLP